MAYLEPRPNGWLIRWREPSGSKLESSELYAKESDATRELGRLQARLDAAKQINASSLIGLERLIGLWAQSRLELGNDPHWTERHRSLLVTMVTAMEWGTVRDITPAEVERWRQRRPKGKGPKGNPKLLVGGRDPRRGALLRGCLRWVMETHRQPVDPFTLIALRPPRLRRRPKAELMTLEEVTETQQRADAIGPDAGALVHCLSRYGWRPATAARLTVGDVAKGQITTSVKGGDIVRHPIAADTIQRLAKLMKGRPADAPLFRHPQTREPFTLDGASGIPQWYRTYMRGKIYDLKRWAITTMLDRGIAAADVKLFTGHRTVAQVLLYLRTNEARAQKALSMMVSGSEQTGKQSPTSANKTKRKDEVLSR